MWVGTEKGLLRWQQDTNDWQRYVHDPLHTNSLSSNYINALHEDDEGVLWIGTQLGAHRLDSETGEIRRFNTGTGLPNDDIHSLIEDVYGTIWMSTGEGLVSMDKVTFEINVYNKDDGLTNDEFLLAAGHAGKSGKVYFGGVKSLVYFDPAMLTTNNIPPLVALTELRVNNERIIPNESDPAALLRTGINMTPSIELPHQQASFAVDFAAMHYADPTKNRYAYRLLGFNDNWAYTDASRRTANYTQLPHGNYTLQVKAANKDGVWDEVGRSLAITVLTPLWATWWAYLLYGVAIVSMVILLIQLRTRSLVGRATHLEQMVQERTRQIRENEELIQTQAENVEQLLHLKEK
jgi:heme exporter protein D